MAGLAGGRKAGGTLDRRWGSCVELHKDFAGMPILLAQALEAPPAAVDAPHWVAGPSPQMLRNAYPNRAYRTGVKGRAALSCTIAADGRMTDCQVAEEAPKGFGFGAAALSLSAKFILSTTTASGQPTAGGKINIPINFGSP